MKNHIHHLLHQAVIGLQGGGGLPEELNVVIEVERARQRGHGDFASNIAMTLAKQARTAPKNLAEKIIAALPTSDYIEKIEIAGPGFINFYLTPMATQQVIPKILAQTGAFGRSNTGEGKRVQIEFVSANPTGPLHVGHGRGAAYGSTLANLLEAVGFNVHREYYVNDAGRQMDILAASVWLRYLDLCGESIVFPVNGYKGDYVWDIGASLHREHGDRFRHTSHDIFSSVSPDEGAANGDKEKHIDGIIKQAKALLGDEDYRLVHGQGLNEILENIRVDLAEFGVEYEEWFSENELVTSGAVAQAIERLEHSGHVYEQEGALWFRSTDFGDEKDRVVIRDNGQHTYFAADIAYHMNKSERGFDRVIDIWGADHHGYVPRVKAAMAAIDEDPLKLEVLLVQFAVLYRGGKKVQMSTRSGEFVTLRELREEVGNDAARFFYVMRKCEQHMDFDLDLAKEQSNDNPVYYIQYAHARVRSVFRQLKEKEMEHDVEAGNNRLDRLNEKHERDLLAQLERYPEIIEQAALKHEPHLLVHYLRELANHFHTYYNAHTFLIGDKELRNARLNLIEATRQVIANALGLLGITAPDSM